MKSINLLPVLAVLCAACLDFGDLPDRHDSGAAAGDAEDFHSRYWSAIGGYVADRLDLPGTAPTALEVQRHLRAAGCDGELVERVQGFGERCDFARFAPGSVDEARVELAREAESLLKSLERADIRRRERR